MEDTGYGNAMTEIALALAMAFFSIMVLAMISMGLGGEGEPASVGAVLAPAASEPAEAAQLPPPTEGDAIVLHFRGAFLDKDLVPVMPEQVRATGRVILALEPDLPMSDALAARARFNVENLVVSVMDGRWLETLERVHHEQR